MQVRELAPWQEGQPVVRFGCRTTELWALRIMVRQGGVPLSLVSELSAGRRWLLGRSLCHVWISFDVMCCTASIWNVAVLHEHMVRGFALVRYVKEKGITPAIIR